MLLDKHFKYRRIIESMILFFFIYKTLKQINNKSIECFRARTLWMRFTRDRTFFPPLWTDEQCDQAAKTSKKIKRSIKNGYVIANDVLVNKY